MAKGDGININPSTPTVKTRLATIDIGNNCVTDTSNRDQILTEKRQNDIKILFICERHTMIHKEDAK